MGVPKILQNVARKPRGLRDWRTVVKRVTEAVYARFWFYHPVKCAPGVFARRPTVRGSTETYTCPGGTRQQFKRFRDPKDFFKYRYGRGGEFARGLQVVLQAIGVRCRFVKGYWGGANAAWVEAWNPYTKRWISLDPAYKHGYGHKFPKKHMRGVVAYEEGKPPVDRLRVYQ